MSTIVRQSFVSCFEQSQYTETATLTMNVAAPPSTTVELSMLGSDHIPQVKENLDITGWSSLQNLSSTTPKYIHPYEKKSRSTEKISLELCTENLGSETGTDISDCGILSNSYCSIQDEPERPLKKESRISDKQANSSRSFPPPLTTIRGGSNSLQVRRHCEGGRLIIEAVESPFKPTYLQAERSDGRLRLCFFQDCDPQTSYDEEEEEEEEEEVNEGCDGEVEDEIIETGERDAIDGEKMENWETESTEEEEEEEEDDDDDDLSIGQVVDVEIGMEKIQRWRRRCNESGHGTKGLCSWKPALWVAIS